MIELDERIITILKTIARGETVEYDSSHYCMYCQGEGIYGQEHPIEYVTHAPGCPILLARTLLQEMDMPLRLYNVSFDRVVSKVLPTNPPFTVKAYELGYSEDEIAQRYQTSPFNGEWIENVQIVYIRDM